MFQKITWFLKKFPLHIFLLPIYFISSIQVEFAGLVSRKESIGAFGYVAVGLLLTYLVLWLIFKNHIKATVLTTISGILYLFFGNIKAVLSQLTILNLISSYKVLLPLILVVLIITAYKLKQQKTAPLQLNLFLNLLLLVYLAIEAGKWSGLSKAQDTPDVLFSPIPPDKSLPRDIYYILLDCYPGTSYQKERLGIFQNKLDTALGSRGFFVVNDSRCNYRSTAFSMASVFNMDYIPWLNGTEYPRPFHFNRAMKMVENGRVFQWLIDNGYSIHNLSIFDLKDRPSIKKERFLSTTGTEIIFYNTLYKSLRRDVIPTLIPALRDDHKRRQKLNNKKLLESFRDYNMLIKDSLQKISRQANQSPNFTYAHFELPHFPYFFDSTGKAYPDELVFGEEMINSAERFTNYLKYTNDQVIDLVDSLLSGNGNQSLIIIQSDHGFNDLKGDSRHDVFRNYMAFYFPDRNYDALKHGMTNVNTFRIIFNKYFSQQLPLLPDSSIYNK